MKKITLFLALFFTTLISAQVANQPSDSVVCDDNNFTPGSSIDPNDINDGLMCFDLSQKNAEVLGSQNPADFIITYHLLQTDADAGMNALSITFCNTSNPQTIYVRLESIATGAFDTTSFMLTVTPSPVVPDSAAIDIFLCDEPSSIDGFTTFNLTTHETYIYGSQSPTDYTLSYFESEADAVGNTNAITNLTSYTNTTFFQAIYIRMTSNVTGCFTIGFFHLIVEAPANLIQPTPLSLCDQNNDEIEMFDLTQRADEITNNDATLTLEYFASLSDLNNDMPIVDPTAFSNTVNPQIIYVETITGDFNCSSVVTLTLSVLPSPSPVLNPTPIIFCDSGNTGNITVDLTSSETEIVNGESNIVVSYYETLSDATMATNAIADPTSFSINVSSIENVYVRVESTIQIDSNLNACATIVTLPLQSSEPLFTSTTYNYSTCDTDNDGSVAIDWDAVTLSLSLLDDSQSIADYTVSYYATIADAQNNVAPLVNGYQNTTNPETVYIRAEHTATGCVNVANTPSLNILVDDQLNVAGPAPYELCNGDGSGYQSFLLTSKDEEIANGQNLTITYHETPEDAANFTNILNATYVNAVPYSQTIYARAESSLTGCFVVVALDLLVFDTCLPTANLNGSYICDDDMDGLICFDLTSRLAGAIGATDLADVTASYHLSPEDTYTNSNAIADPVNFCTTEVTQDIYIRVENIVTNDVFERVFTLGRVIIETTEPTPYVVCDENGDGHALFTPASKIQEIINGNAGYTVRFYRTLADAQSETSILGTVFTNLTPFSETIYARVESNNPLYTSANCSVIVPLELIASSTICATANADTYEVSTIPHTIYDINAVPTSNLDDYFTDVVAMPFDFDFFNETYNEFTIGTNGLVTFNTFNANTNCRWQLEAGQEVPSFELYLNSIFGVYHDLDNTGDGTLGYGIVGEAPFRKMVVFFDNMNQFSAPCVDPTTTQIILYETFNIIDVQIEQKLACTTWNNGLAVLGIQNQDASVGYIPADRNMGVWDATNEGHRFEPISTYENVFSVLCDTNLDGIMEFNLQDINDDLLDGVTGTVSYYFSEDDLLNNANVLPELYTNTSNAQKIYARVINSTTNEVTIKTVTLAGISCAEDYDLDGVSTMDEDVNQDGNLGNDDTDGDGIPDFIDEDDDGDYVLTNLELINTATGLPENSFLDTDGDLIPNHRDNDDDGDGTLTVDEDYNGNNNPEDDDTNNNNIPDYLDNMVFLNVDEFTATSVRMYPNPVKDKLTVEAKANVRIQSIELYSVEGRLVHAQKQAIATNSLTIDVSNFASGFYVLRMKTQANTIIAKQFIVE